VRLLHKCYLCESLIIYHQYTDGYYAYCNGPNACMDFVSSQGQIIRCRIAHEGFTFSTQRNLSESTTFDGHLLICNLWEPPRLVVVPDVDPSFILDSQQCLSLLRKLLLKANS